MRFVFRLATAITFAAVSTASLAGAIYTSSGSFLANVKPGSYTETFNGLSNASSPSFTGGAFAYTASAPNDIYFSGDFLGTNQVGDALTITFTSGNVTALGANFFATDISDSFQVHSLTLTLSDGTVATFTPVSQADSYRGFTTDVAISSLVVSGTAGTSLYASLDNLTVGVSAVPEPETWALFAAGLLGLRLVRRRSA
jgi:hypothetical protein